MGQYEGKRKQLLEYLEWNKEAWRYRRLKFSY